MHWVCSIIKVLCDPNSPGIYYHVHSLSLALNILALMCLDVNLFEIILLGVHGASWMINECFSIKFGMFSAIISSIVFLIPFSPSDTPIMHLMVYLMVSDFSEALFIFLHSFFSLFLRLDNLYLIYLQVHH